jgi:hypothetical protein
MQTQTRNYNFEAHIYSFSFSALRENGSKIPKILDNPASCAVSRKTGFRINGRENIQAFHQSDIVLL